MIFIQTLRKCCVVSAMVAGKDFSMVKSAFSVLIAEKLTIAMAIQKKIVWKSKSANIA